MEERWIGVMTEYPKTRNAVLYEKNVSKKWNCNKIRKIKEAYVITLGPGRRVREPLGFRVSPCKTTFYRHYTTSSSFQCSKKCIISEATCNL